MSIIKLNNNGVKNATAFGSINVLGSMVFIKKLTASSSANLSFVDGSSSVVLDNTYKEYLFTFNNIHPSNDSVYFQFNMSTDGGSNYNVAKTSTAIYAYHRENDADNRLLYGDTYDPNDFLIAFNFISASTGVRVSISISRISFLI